MSHSVKKWERAGAVFLLFLLLIFTYSPDLTEANMFYGFYLPAALMVAAWLTAWLAGHNSSSDKHCCEAAQPSVPTRDHLPAMILEQLPEGILLLDADSILRYQNSTARLLFGLTEGNRVDAAVLAQMFSMSVAELEQGFDINNPCSTLELERIRQFNGQERLFKYEIRKAADITGAYRLIMAADHTELTITRHEAETANQFKNQFLANISHEVRTPMIGVLGAVDLLEQSPLSAKQLDNLSIIRECGEQLLAIINEILDVSKIETGLVDLNPTSCRIRPFLSQCCKMVEPLLKDKALKVQIHVDEELPETILLDQAKMQHIITNILGNAAKFTHRGVVSVEACHSGSPSQPSLLLTIQDTGIGISAEALPLIFAPFTQVDNSSSRQYGGTGLGLYICQKLATLLGGSIRAESQPGLGTTLYIEVPLLADRSPSPAETGEIFNLVADHAAWGFEAPRVLLTEDNLLNQKIILQMLNNYGFYCRVAADGLQCLQALHQEHFDVVLLDMQMPVMDGYETAAMIRQDTSLSGIAVIAMTAHSMVGDREKCLASGCSDYISKPFKANQLAELITRHLPGSRWDTAARSENSIINDLMPELLEMLEEMLKSLYECWHKKDLNGLQSLSHDIKGTSGMYGLTEISNLAAQLEKDAREHDYGGLAAKIIQLQEKYLEVKVLFLGKSSENCF